MKIVQLIDTLNVGGAERMVVNIANTFCEEGIDNAILCTRTSGKLENNLSSEVKIFVAKKKHSLDIRAFYRGLKYIQRIKPDVIHAHSSSLFWAVIYVLFYSNCVLVWHDHNGKRPSFGIVKNLPYQLLSFRVNIIISVNDQLKKWATENLFVKKDKIKYLRNFPYLKLLKKEEIAKKIFTILMIANFREPKDHHTLIHAISLLKKECKFNFKLICLGKINEKSKYTQELYSLIKEYELESFVKFLGQGTAESALNIADVGVLASKSEGLPVSLLEYGIASLPVVVTDVGQCAEVVGNGEFGFIVPPQAPDKLANALRCIFEDYESALIMGEKFKKHITKEYGSKKFLTEYYNLLNLNC